MNVLGMSGRNRDAAAALAVDGRIVAAASEESFTRVPGIGYAQTGGVPAAAIAACLERAGLSPRDLDRVAIVEETGDAFDRQVPLPESRVAVDPVLADAVQAAASVEATSSVFVCSAQPASAASFTARDGLVQAKGRMAGADGLMVTARTLAEALGVRESDPYRALDRISIGGEPEFLADWTSVVDSSSGNGPMAHADRLGALLAMLGARHAGRLDDGSSMNVRLQATRRNLAASFLCRTAQVVAEAIERDGPDGGRIALGGSVLASARVAGELREITGDRLRLSAVPEPAGRAIGAALSASESAFTPLSGLALGPAFSDHDIKRTLDNCRLDYVYEPDWARLFARASKMLAQGKVVAWFQGSMAFGPRANGTRSILCDPSSRYARQNVNEYLRQTPIDDPLPLVFAPSAAAACLGAPPRAVADVVVAEEVRGQVLAALDWRGRVRVHPLDDAHAPDLCRLLECHRERTGVPALIETNLSGVGEPMACTPRDAVRTVYSSSIDALIIGRFVLMKDYWLLRTNAD